MSNQLSHVGLAIQLSKIIGLLKNQGLASFMKILSGYLKHWIHERCGCPNSISNDKYADWIEICEAKSLSIAEDIRIFSRNPKLIICVVVENEYFLDDTIQSLNNQVYTNFETIFACFGEFNKCNELSIRYGIKEDNLFWIEGGRPLMGFIRGCTDRLGGDFLLFVTEPDVLSPLALLEIARVVSQSPWVKYVYSDEDTIDGNGVRGSPFFKPDWSPDLLMSFPYTGSLSAFAAESLRQLGGATAGCGSFDLYDLTLRVTECLGDREIFHVPKVLIHRRTRERGTWPCSGFTDAAGSSRQRRALAEALQRRGIQGEVVDGNWAGSFRVRRRWVGTPRVSIIIPTRDRLKLLRRCVESIESKTTYGNYQILVVDNRSSDPGLQAYLESFSHAVVRHREAFNFSRINNAAARLADGELLLFLNNDVEVISPDWIESMLEHALREEVGAVGCKLLYPNGSIQHAGIVLGMDPDGTRAVAGHVFKRLKAGDMGYFGLAHVVRNLSAVTAAAMMVRRSVFEAMGGFDEELTVSYNDVDFCLRLRQEGYLIVYTPFAQLYHHESATRIPGANLYEISIMARKWGNALHRDPYYSPNLSLRSHMCGIALALDKRTCSPVG